MAIRTVVTRGYGNGTFTGTIGLVVARGYLASAAAVEEEPAAAPAEVEAADRGFDETLRAFAKQHRENTDEKDLSAIWALEDDMLARILRSIEDD